MLLNDSVELEYTDYSASAEPLPLNWDIELSQIWIPSSLLPNRKRLLNPNENKPFVYHTLVKPDESKSFSVYSDECSKYLEPQTSTAVSPQKLTNDSFQRLQQGLPTPHIEVESDTKLGTYKEEISLLQPVNSGTFNDSLTDVEEINSSTAKNAILWKKKTYDCSNQSTLSKASIDDLARRMEEILSEEELLETDWFHEDIIEAKPFTTPSTFDNIPPSTNDSPEEIYYSGEDEDQFDIEEYEFANRESEYPEKKFINSIYTDNSYSHEKSSESFTNDLTEFQHAKNNIIKTVCESFKETTEIPFENQKMADDDVCNQTEHNELNNLEKAVLAEDSVHSPISCEEETKDYTEKVVELPFAYVRPPLQEPTNKTKPKKEKKKVKKCKINMPLEDLFQKEEVDRFKVPEFDEFYENLVRQGKCQPHNPKTDFDHFPPVDFPEKLQSNIHNFPSRNFPEVSQAIVFQQSLDSELHSSSPPEVIQNEKIEHELESNLSLNTIVIDNIHLNVSKESIQSFISGYGVVKKLVVEHHEKFQRAILQMDFNCEIDWIIDCLNGSQPFECFDKEVVKCYRLT